MTQPLIKIALIAVLFAIVGTITALVVYAVVQFAGLIPAPPRTLDGLVAFLDRLVMTAVALTLAGLVAGGLIWRGRSNIACMLASGILAALVAALLQPPMTVLSAHVASVGVSAFLMTAIVRRLDALRPAPAAG